MKTVIARNLNNVSVSSRGAYSPNKRAVAVAQAAYDALETLYERLAVACGKEQCKE